MIREDEPSTERRKVNDRREGPDRRRDARIEANSGKPKQDRRHNDRRLERTSKA